MVLISREITRYKPRQRNRTLSLQGLSNTTKKP
nr:MAG TPA_asm: hypothetical protein [Caudoviricetes sp.]